MQLPLNYLDIRANSLNDECIEIISEMESLTFLDISGVCVSIKSIPILQNMLDKKRLKFLGLFTAIPLVANFNSHDTLLIHDNLSIQDAFKALLNPIIPVCGTQTLNLWHIIFQARKFRDYIIEDFEKPLILISIEYIKSKTVLAFYGIFLLWELFQNRLPKKNFHSPHGNQINSTTLLTVFFFFFETTRGEY